MNFNTFVKFIRYVNNAVVKGSINERTYSYYNNLVIHREEEQYTDKI
jgi:hypothetical protein